MQMSERLPPPENYAVAGERIRCLQALHSASVTSNGRGEARNARVGGHENSKHLILWGCNAWDLSPEKAGDVVKLAADARLFGFWVKTYDTYIHAQSISPGAPVPVSI